eukprot:jgi/Psemu1/199154/e_gw1.232.77.1
MAIVFLCLAWSNYYYVSVEALFFSPIPATQSANLPTSRSNSNSQRTITRIRTRAGARTGDPGRHRTTLQQSSSQFQSSSQSQSQSQSTPPQLPPGSSLPTPSLPTASELQQPLSQALSPSAAQLAFAKSFRNILARKRNNHHRQRFVTGQFPVIVTVEENPTQKWLNLGRSRRNSNEPEISTAVVLVNGTNIDKSLASYDRFQWLDETERQELHDRYASVSVELLAEIAIDKPGYLQILPSDGAGSAAALARREQREQEQQQTDGNGNAAPLWNREEPFEKPKPIMHDRLWSTGFSLTSPRGFIRSVDICNGHIDEINPRSESMITWPNEITKVPAKLIIQQKQQKQHEQQQRVTNFMESLSQDALLVADGFLVPGKDRGGIYVVQNPAHKESEWSIPLTNPVSSDRWFYHKSIWVDLTGDGRQSILTARAKLRKQDPDVDVEMEKNRPKNGQLIWLEMPKPHRYDAETGTALEKDGTAFNPFDARHLPWKERVLATGPDVTFAVADMDPSDDTIEVLASQFFDEKVTLHSIQRGPNPRVTFSRVIDDSPGAAFGGILVDLEEGENKQSRDRRRAPRVINSGSTMKSLGEDEKGEGGSPFSHFLVTSHEFNSNSVEDSHDIANNMMMTEHKGGAKGKKQTPSKVRGGSLLAYKVPKGSSNFNKDAWKTEPWIRTTIASGFQVKQQIWNVINPGAPGFAYAFHAHKDDEARGKRPMIAVAGDCAESAYIFRPQQSASHASSTTTTTTTSTIAPATTAAAGDGTVVDPQAEYKLMCEIKCGATVGSIAVGYEDLCSAEQESGYAKIYVPCFEKDKILVFALGSGEEEDRTVDPDDSGW